MIIDSHCHLNQLNLDNMPDGLSGAIDAASMRGVSHFLCVAIDFSDYDELKNIAEQHQQISFSVGVHPCHYDFDNDCTTSHLLALSKHPKVVALGETGLDYHYPDTNKHSQKKRFETHIEAAIACQKPLIIHTRDARADTIDILKHNQADQCGAVLHCFTETVEMARQALDLGFYISISGIVTFKNAKQVQEVAAYVPEDRLLVETDSPYLAPVPYRGKPNFPAYVVEVGECVANIRGVSYEKLAAFTTENYQRLFGDIKAD